MNVAIAAMPLTAMTGMAVDYSRASGAQTQIQAAMDAAVLAGASDGTAGWEAVALSIYRANAGRYADGATPTFDADDGVYTGSVTVDVDTTFAAIIQPFMSVTAESEARREAGRGTVCILLLDPSKTFQLNSGPDIIAPDCEVHVRSTGNPAIGFDSGSSIRTRRICVAGRTMRNNGGVHPNVEMSCAAIADPFAGTLPVPSTTSSSCQNRSYNAGTIVLRPGVFCGGLNFNSGTTVRFEPGVYVLRGGAWNFNGSTITGDGVTFYYADANSSIHFNSNVLADLKAPTSGAYAGILIYEARGLSQSWITWDDARGSRLEGLIYLPSRNVTYNSGSKLDGHQVTIVYNSLMLNRTTWNLSGSAANMSATGGATGGSGQAYLSR